MFSERRTILKVPWMAPLLLTLIPVVNFIAVPTAVAGATALWVGEFAGGAGETQREQRGS